MRAFVLAAIALVALSGCSSKDTSTSGATDSATSGSVMHDHSPHTYAVVLKGNQFVNGTLIVYEGDTVEWHHEDGMVGHSVTADDGTFDSHPNCAAPVLPGPLCMANGETYSHTFTTKGEVSYHCRVHASMTGKITILEHPAM